MTESELSASPNLGGEARRLLRVALPMMIAQGGLMTMGLVDAFLIGRVSALDMGAVALGNGIVGVVMVLGVGLCMGIEPLAAQAFGAGRPARAYHWLWQGLWSALLLAPLLCLALIATTWVLRPFGIEDAIAARTTEYVYSRLPGVVFNCAYSAYRSYLTSVERARPVLVAVLIANVVNVALDLTLIFGLGLGAMGVGLATSACWGVMTAVAAVAAVSATPHLPAEARAASRRPVSADMRRVAGLGMPIGLQLSVEVGVFSMVSMLIARLGQAPLAGHQIAITLASFTFMCAVGLAVGTTARVGFHIGAGDGPAARRSGLLGIGMGGVFMGTCGLMFLVFARPLAQAFAPNDPEVVEIGTRLLRIAAVFSVSDGVQTVAAGALRGVGDTRFSFVANLVAHWFVGLPVALALGYGLGWGSSGFWWGLSVGLLGVAMTLTTRFTRMSKRAIARLDN